MMTGWHGGRTALVATFLFGSAAVHAQSITWSAQAGSPADAVGIMGQGPVPAGPAQPLPFFIGGADVQTMVSPFGMAGGAVTGAPYSAEGVTEVVQQLADGNRIVRRSNASVYRDSNGRLRRETGLAVIGAVVGEPAERRQVQISDPQTHVSYLLDMENRTAHKMMTPAINIASMPPDGTRITAVNPNAEKGVEVVREGSVQGLSVAPLPFDMPVPPPPDAGFVASADGAGGGVHMMYRATAMRGAGSPPVVEQLGKQTIEGVEAEGTRATTTIPAGMIGNEQPINIVYERWFSPDLKVLVLSRQSDPRFGETTYRLTNIVRTEPAADLFEVPADFKVITPDVKRDVIIRRQVR